MRKAKVEKIIEKLKAKSKIFNFKTASEKHKRKFYDFAFHLWFFHSKKILLFLFNFVITVMLSTYAFDVRS